MIIDSTLHIYATEIDSNLRKFVEKKISVIDKKRSSMSGSYFSQLLVIVLK